MNSSLTPCLSGWHDTCVSWLPDGMSCGLLRCCLCAAFPALLGHQLVLCTALCCTLQVFVLHQAVIEWLTDQEAAGEYWVGHPGQGLLCLGFNLLGGNRANRSSHSMSRQGGML